MNVHYLPGCAPDEQAFPANGEVAADKVLEAGIGLGLCEVLVLGIEPNGRPYFAATTSDPAALLLALERARIVIMQHDPHT